MSVHRREGRPRPGGRRWAVAAVAVGALALVTTAGQPKPGGADRGAGTRHQPRTTAPPTQADAPAIPASVGRPGGTAGSGAADRIDVVAQTAWVEPDGSFLAGLSVDEAPPGSRIEATLHGRLQSRAELAPTIFGVDLPEALATVPPIDLPTGRGEGSIVIRLRQQAPSAPGDLSLSRGLGGAGAYPVRIDLVAPDGEVLDTVVTYLLRAPTEPNRNRPLPVALVLPLHDAPATDPDGETEVDPDLVGRITDLAASLRSHGGVPLAVHATPETMASLAADSAGPLALATLQQALDGRTVIDAPYVDIPLAGWVDAGITGEVGRQRERGRAALTSFLATPDSGTWVERGALDDGTVALLARTGVDRLVVRSDSVTSRDGERPDGSGPFALSVADLPDPVQVLVAERPDLLSAPDVDPQMAAQRFLASLTTAWTERVAEGDSASPLVEMPDRGWVADPASLDPVLAALTEGAGIVRAVDLGDAFASSADEIADLPSVTTTGDAPGLGTYPQDLLRARTRLASFAGMFPDDPTLPSALAELLDVSGDRTTTAQDQQAYLDAVEREIDRTMAAVDLPTRQTITLTSREGQFPVVLRNTLAHPVTVLLSLDAGRRIEFPDGDEMVLDLEPGTNRIQVQVRTLTPGAAPVTVRVTSPDAALDLARTRYTVRSTAISGVGAIITVGAALLLLVWWFRHWRRDRRARHRSARREALLREIDETPTPT